MAKADGKARDTSRMNFVRRAGSWPIFIPVLTTNSPGRMNSSTGTSITLTHVIGLFVRVCAPVSTLAPRKTGSCSASSIVISLEYAARFVNFRTTRHMERAAPLSYCQLTLSRQARTLGILAVNPSQGTA